VRMQLEAQVRQVSKVYLVTTVAVNYWTAV